MDPLPRSSSPGATRRPVSLNPVVNLRHRLNRMPGYLWQDRVRDAFWKFGTLFSLGVNLVLVLAVLLLAQQLFAIKQAVAEPLIGGLHTGFVQMDSAHIRSSISVEDEIAVAFDLPVKENTVVTLSEAARIEGATVTIQSGVLGIFNAPATVTLPAGTRLPIQLDFSVPVKAQVPVTLEVPVDIPLSETELHGPFVRLRDLFAPYRTMLDDLPDCWAEALWGGACR